MEDEFNINSTWIYIWNCAKKTLELSTSEGVVILKIPSQIASYVTKITYSIETSAEGITFSSVDRILEECKPWLWCVGKIYGEITKRLNFNPYHQYVEFRSQFSFRLTDEKY